MTGAQRFRKKPVEIEAVEFLGGPNNATDVIEWILAGNGTARYVGRGEYHPMRYPEELMVANRDIEACEDAPAFLVIDTLEGAHRANGGDWIIRGVQGEFYPCKPDIFAETYDPA